MKLALFDFDGTLFPKETIPFLVQQFWKTESKKYRVIGFYSKTLFYLFRYKVLKQIDKVTFRKKAVVYFLALFHGETATTVNDFFKRTAKEVIRLLDPQIVQEVKKAKGEGFHTVILSGCFSELLETVAEAIAIDSVVGTEVCFVNDDHGTQIYKDGTPIDIVADERKVAAIVNAFAYADWNHSIAYADSCYDEPILSLVGHKVAVNPDRILSKIAAEKKWDVLRTKHK